MSAISPELSEKGTNKYLVEVKVVNFLQDFLHEFEGKLFTFFFLFLHVIHNIQIKEYFLN